MSFTVTEAERATAEYYLAGAADGSKLPYSAQNKDGRIEPRGKTNQRTKARLFNIIEQHNRDVEIHNRRQPDKPKNRLEHTFHSFIKLAGTIYAIDRQILGRGSNGSVRLLLDPQNQVCVLKKEINPNKISVHELLVLVDRTQSTGRHQAHYLHSEDNGAIRPTATHYTQMDYLGTTIAEYLEANPQLSDDQRLEIAILLCLEIHDLHCIRSKSVSKTAFAHRDLKTTNATIEIIGGKIKVHLIDFGFTTPNPKKSVINDSGTPLFRPRSTESDFILEVLDLFALKRCLYMPDNFWHCLGHMANFYQNPDYVNIRGILSEQQMQNPILNRYVNTSSSHDERKYYNNDSISALALAAILIAVRLKLNIPAEQLAANPAKALVVTALYQENQTTMAIEDALENDSRVRHIAAFAKIDLYAQMQNFFQDPEFAKAMNTTSTLEQACALVFCKSLGISNYAALSNPLTAQAICFVHEQPKILWTREYIEKILSNTFLSEIIVFLEKHQKQVCFKFVLNASEFDLVKSLAIQILIKHNINLKICYEKVTERQSLAKAIYYLDISEFTPLTRIIYTDQIFSEAVTIYGDNTPDSERTCNFLPPFLWNLCDAMAVIYLSEHNLASLINKAVPQLSKCINVLKNIKNPTFDSSDIDTLLRNRYAQEEVAKLEPEQAHAYIILFNNGIAINDFIIDNIISSPEYAQTIICCNKRDKSLVSSFINIQDQPTKEPGRVFNKNTNTLFHETRQQKRLSEQNQNETRDIFSVNQYHRP